MPPPVPWDMLIFALAIVAIAFFLAVVAIAAIAHGQPAVAQKALGTIGKIASFFGKKSHPDDEQTPAGEPSG